MNKRTPNNRRRNKSNSSVNPFLQKAINKIYTKEAGTVTYYFVEERIVFPPEHPNGKTIKNKTVLQSNINKDAFYKQTKKGLEKKSPIDLIEMFKTTQWDLGANYFKVD